MKKFPSSIQTVVKRCFIILTTCLAISIFNSCTEKSLEVNPEQPNDRPVANGIIAGKVLDASLNTPIPNAFVELFPDEIYLYSNNSGEFIFNNIKAGEYTVVSVADGYESAVVTANVSTGSIANCTLYMKRETNVQPPVANGIIAGKVLDASLNTPIPNAFVELFPDEIYLYSNDSGEFRFNNIKAGEYTVVSVADGYESAVVTANVSAGSIANCTLYMKKETNIQPTEDYSSAQISWDLPDLEVELISCKRKANNVEFVYTMTNTDMLRNQSVTINNVNAVTNHTHIADNLGNQYPRDQVKISLAGRDYGYANNTDGMLLGGIPSKVVITIKAVDAAATEMHFYIYTSTAKAGGMNYASDIIFRNVRIY